MASAARVVGPCLRASDFGEADNRAQHSHPGLGPLPRECVHVCGRPCSALAAGVLQRSQ